MKNKNLYIRSTAYLLIAIPLIMVLVRFYNNEKEGNGLKPGYFFYVGYNFQLYGKGDFEIKTFLPINNERQEISEVNEKTEVQFGKIQLSNENKQIHWKGELYGKKEINYSFKFKGKHIKYNVDEELKIKDSYPPVMDKYLASEEFIQSDHNLISSTAYELTGKNTNLYETLESFFKFVSDIPERPISQLTDAVTALKKYEASCNGKSRLFVALCRNKGIPARVAGGIILENIEKKTSHLWAEVYINGNWIPFDPLYDYFAEIPSNYLELYKGDHFLITRNTNIEFDYLYSITKHRVNHYPNYAIVDLWTIMDNTKVNSDVLMILLLLPLGAFIVALFKNVVGLKTYGIFLPVLIGFAFMETGLLSGFLIFTAIVSLISIINYPLDKWGLLHTPKMVVMLTAVVLFCIASTQVFYSTALTDPNTALFFPIIILTITAEKFARKIEEESIMDAGIIYAQTIVVCIVCYFILSSVFIQNFIITFPEILLSVGGMSVLLGKWIGLRITEYNRFYKLIKKEYSYA